MNEWEENLRLKAELINMGAWIPVSEAMPEDLETVLITWKNTQPEPYYQHIKDLPFTNPAVYYRGKWYWWDSTIQDFLAEYGERFGAIEPMDEFIEITAWMPMPEPYLK
jgi:hypothetical protein